MKHRREFLHYAGAALAASLTGCGEARQIGKKLGICCKREHRGPAIGATLNNGGAQFDESRLIAIINDTKHQVTEYDPDIIGFVNRLYEKVYGSQIPHAITIEYANPGRPGEFYFETKHIKMAEGLKTTESLHTTFHELGHNIARPEIIAETAAFRADMESITHYPEISKQTNLELPAFCLKRALDWGRGPGDGIYGDAYHVAFLSVLKNSGSLAAAQNDVNTFLVSTTDSKWLVQRNSQADSPVGNHIRIIEELKDAAMAAWWDKNEQHVREDLRETVFALIKKTDFTLGRLHLPPGIIYPASYDSFVERSKKTA